MAFVVHIFVDDRYNREPNDRKHRVVKIFLNNGDITEEKPKERKHAYPERTPDDVIHDKFFILHCPHTRHKRRESTYNRHEPREDDRFASILLVELFRFVDVFLIDKFNVRIINNFSSEKMSDPIVHRVTQNSRNEKQDENEPDMK